MRAESLSVDLQPDLSCINENTSDYLQAHTCLIFDFFYSLNVPVQRPGTVSWMSAHYSSRSAAIGCCAADRRKSQSH